MDVQKIRGIYPVGMKVKLTKMEGEDKRMPAGLIGTVLKVDDIGQVHVSWENGSSLALNLDVDKFSEVTGKKSECLHPPID